VAFQNKLIFLIGRDNWQKDDLLNHILISYLKRTNFEIIWEDPAGELLYKLRRLEHQIKWLPNSVKILNLRIVQVLFGVFNWKYFSYLSNRTKSSPKIRIQKLKESLIKLQTDKEIIILSRSAGGRFASRIADELKLNRIICLSYPFKHPNENDQPDRYSHLKDIETPMLIIQGTKDEYGGLGLELKYELSSNIELFFIEANHDFNISIEEWEKVLLKINSFISLS
jgi:hypothetical protein